MSDTKKGIIVELLAAVLFIISVHFFFQIMEKDPEMSEEEIRVWEEFKGDMSKYSREEEVEVDESDIFIHEGMLVIEKYIGENGIKVKDEFRIPVDELSMGSVEGEGMFHLYYREINDEDKKDFTGYAITRGMEKEGIYQREWKFDFRLRE